MKARLGWGISGGVVILLVYYFFLRQAEFEVNFAAKTLPGDLIETLRLWNRSLDNAEITSVDSFTSLTQVIEWQKKKKYVYKWNFTVVNDSLTKVNVQITEPGHGFWNKLLVPFSEQEIEVHAKEIVNIFYDLIKEHLEITKVKLIGEAELDSTFCVCTTIKSDQIDKANGMMKNYSMLTSFINAHHLQEKGWPMIEVTQWNHAKGLISFDFCFPVVPVPVDSLPKYELISYRHFGRGRALKAEYHGNYITSDRAWYELVNYANKNGYKIKETPIEYFQDNPTLGIGETKWKAEVFVPIIE